MDLAKKILHEWAMTKPQRTFLLNLFTTILALRGKVNFRNLSRYSGLSARTYARQFGQPFDFIGLNRALIDRAIPADGPRLVVFDPSFIPKAVPAGGLVLPYTVPTGVCQTFYVQVLQLDSAAVLGVSMTPGLRLTIGN